MMGDSAGPAAAALSGRLSALGVRHVMAAHSAYDRDMRAVLVPRAQADDFQTHGTDVLGMHGFALGPDAQKLKAMPDTSMLVQLPWDPEVAWMPCNLYLLGEPFAQCPRQALKAVIDKAAAQNLTCKAAVELEFELVDDNGDGVDKHDHKEFVGINNPYMLVKHMDFLKEIVDCLDGLGWKPTQASKEGRPNQFEINFAYDNALQAADKHMFTKFMIKTLALRRGMRATFMPYRTPLKLGNAMHLNISLWDAKTDTNILPGGGGGGDAAAGSGLSVRGRAALAGLLHHVPALTAIMCPTVNSYKRLSHWPNFVHLVSWAVENRMALVRVPAGTADRLEVRLPDGATNPYLLPASALAAMLSGLDGDMDLSSAQELAVTPPPGSPQLAGFTSVPRSLPDALAALAADTRLAAYLPPALTGGYAYVRNNEWQAFLSAITQFELASLDDY